MHNIEKEMQRIIFDNSFRISEEILRNHFNKMYAANPKNISERCFLWIYSNGQSVLLEERNLFILGTVEHNFLGFFGSGNNKNSLGYMIQLCCSDSNVLQGYVDKVDLEFYYHHVRCLALPEAYSLFRYEKGLCDNPMRDGNFGRFILFHPQVADNRQLEALLKKEQDQRDYDLFYAIRNVNESSFIYNCVSNNVSLARRI